MDILKIDLQIDDLIFFSSYQRPLKWQNCDHFLNMITDNIIKSGELLRTITKEKINNDYPTT